MRPFAMIEQKLGYRFKNPLLLETALTHSSYANEFRRESNERLEFLGDAFLGSVVSRLLYEKFPSLSEGELSRAKSGVVSGSSFAECARGLGLGGHLRLGKGEERSGGREKDSVLADAFEALMGAVYLDAGHEKAFGMAGGLLEERLGKGHFPPDPKTRLQEVCREMFGREPRYATVGEEGPPHRKRFAVEVSVSPGVSGEGRGGSRKAAERAAAENALGKLGR